MSGHTLQLEGRDPSADDELTWTIDWNDGSEPEEFADGTNPVHTFTQAGTYSVSITLADDDGGETTVIREFHVYELPGNGVPYFLQPEYAFDLSEFDPTESDIVGTVTADDPDSEVVPTYTIQSGNGAGHFSIDAQGNIHLLSDPSLLPQGPIELMLAADDAQQQRGVAAVVVDVRPKYFLDGDDWSVPENSAVDTLVGILDLALKAPGGKTKPVTAALTWTITGGDFPGTFKTVGDKLKVADPSALNYEKNKSLQVHLSASKGAKVLWTGSIRVEILDEPENRLPDANSAGILEVLPTYAISHGDLERTLGMAGQITRNALEDENNGQLRAQVAARINEMVRDRIDAANYPGGPGDLKGSYLAGEVTPDMVKGALGLSGYIVVWDITAKANADGETFDFRNLQVRVLPWYVVVSEVDRIVFEEFVGIPNPALANNEFAIPRFRVRTGNDLTSKHEKWHTDGVPDGIYTALIQQGANIPGDQRRIGYRGEAVRRIEALKKALVGATFKPAPGVPTLTDQKALDVARALVERFVTSKAARTAILDAGLWHLDDNDFDINILRLKRDMNLDISRSAPL